MKLDKANLSTRDHLLLTAERLFATEGIESVSLRHIAREGGQKNVGAMQYHFGDRMGLFEALMEFRMTGLNEMRRQMLDELDAGKVEANLRNLIRCFVCPYVEHIRQEGLESYYVEFLARFQVSHPTYLRDVNFHKPWQNAIIELSRRLVESLGDIPEYLRFQRLTFMSVEMIQSVAEFERGVRNDETAMDQLDVFTENLIDSLVGMVSAPISPATREALETLSPS